MSDYEWWENVDENWEDLLNAISEFHPGYRRSRPMKITAPNAEVACREFADEIAKETNFDPTTVATQAKLSKDGKTLHKLFNQTWFGIPESRECWSIPSFGILCDLCSEFEGYQDEGE